MHVNYSGSPAQDAVGCDGRVYPSGDQAGHLARHPRRDPSRSLEPLKSHEGNLVDALDPEDMIGILQVHRPAGQPLDVGAHLAVHIHGVEWEVLRGAAALDGEGAA